MSAVVGDSVVERKTLGDLAGRSARAHGSAHHKLACFFFFFFDKF